MWIVFFRGFHKKMLQFRTYILRVYCYNRFMIKYLFKTDITISMSDLGIIKQVLYSSLVWCIYMNNLDRLSLLTNMCVVLHIILWTVHRSYKINEISIVFFWYSRICILTNQDPIQCTSKKKLVNFFLNIQSFACSSNIFVTQITCSRKCIGRYFKFLIMYKKKYDFISVIKWKSMSVTKKKNRSFFWIIKCFEKVFFNY